MKHRATRKAYAFRCLRHIQQMPTLGIEHIQKAAWF